MAIDWRASSPRRSPSGVCACISISLARVRNGGSRIFLRPRRKASGATAWWNARELGAARCSDRRSELADRFRSAGRRPELLSALGVALGLALADRSGGSHPHWNWRVGMDVGTILWACRAALWTSSFRERAGGRGDSAGLQNARVSHGEAAEDVAVVTVNSMISASSAIRRIAREWRSARARLGNWESPVCRCVSRV